MISKYIKYEVNKENLDRIKVGDLIKINDAKKPMKVKGVSENYFVMAQKNFKDIYYSVCEKKKWNGENYNSMRGGYRHCGKDNWIFGAPDFDYNFDNEKSTNDYLQTFEKGRTKLSHRNAIPIYEIYIKRTEETSL